MDDRITDEVILLLKSANTLMTMAIDALRVELAKRDGRAPLGRRPS